MLLVCVFIVFLHVSLHKLTYTTRNDGFESFIFLAFCLLTLIASSFAQTPADSISSTFPKFLVRNEKGQVLLVYDTDRQAWEVPGLQYAGPISFKNSVDKAAKEFGISYDQMGLGGLFTYHYPYRYKTVIRPYFTMHFTGFLDGKDFSQIASFKWFDTKDIEKVILYPASAMIVKQIIQYPKTVWSAAFEEYGYTNPMTDPSKIKFRVIEPFYKFNQD